MHQIVAVVPETRFIEKKKKNYRPANAKPNSCTGYYQIKLDLSFFFFMVGCLVMVLNYL